MQLLVWQGHGAISLYDYQVSQGLKKLKELVNNVLEYGYEAEDTCRITEARSVREIVEIVNEITYDDESFERFEIMEVETL